MQHLTLLDMRTRSLPPEPKIPLHNLGTNQDGTSSSSRCPSLRSLPSHILTSLPALCLLALIACVVYISSCYLKSQLRLRSWCSGGSRARRHPQNRRRIFPREKGDAEDVEERGEFISPSTIAQEEERREIIPSTGSSSTSIMTTQNSSSGSTTQSFQPPTRSSTALELVPNTSEMSEISQLPLMMRTCLRRRAEGVSMGRHGVKGSVANSGIIDKSVTWRDGRRGTDASLVVAQDVEGERPPLEEVFLVEFVEWPAEVEVEEQVEEDWQSCSSSSGSEDDEVDDHHDPELKEVEQTFNRRRIKVDI